jgi:hypothetical protein
MLSSIISPFIIFLHQTKDIIVGNHIDKDTLPDESLLFKPELLRYPDGSRIV